jgi:hypothetical protein
MEISELTICDKKIFDNYFESADLQLSELNFTNFYIWKDYYRIRYCIINNFLCIFSFIDDNFPFSFFPIGDYSDKENLKNAIYAVKDYFSEIGKPLVFGRVAAEQLTAFEDLDFDYTLKEDRNNFDYLYDVQKLITLSGKKLDGKRNHINKLKKNHTYEYEEISSQNVAACKLILEKWYTERNYTEDASLVAERKANLILLENFRVLNLKGAIINIDGKPEAFTFGERLNSNTVVIHAEKANAEIDGIYPLINQQFLANQWSDFEYVNREQDLGIEGLRRAKLSYNPARLVEKFTISLC